jgi:uncharacterized BrkB/YihY/UPF0761 family membrane protein
MDLGLRSIYQGLFSLKIQAYVARLVIMILLTFFPFVLFVMTVLSLVVEPQAWINLLEFNLAPLVPLELLETLNQALLRLLEDANFSLLSLAGLVLCYVIFVATMQHGAILADLLQREHPKNIFVRLLQALGLVVAFVLLGFGMVQFVVFSSEVLSFAGRFWPELATGLPILFWRWPVLLMTIFVASFVLYFLGANLGSYKQVRAGALAALFFTVTFVLASQLFNRFAGLFLSYNLAYGLLGVLILLIFYLQIVCYLYLWGVLLLRKNLPK